jgi:hypothetical protein
MSAKLTSKTITTSITWERCKLGLLPRSSGASMILGQRTFGFCPRTASAIELVMERIARSIMTNLVPMSRLTMAAKFNSAPVASKETLSKRLWD